MIASGSGATRIPRHNQSRKRCKCPSGVHERLTREQRDYLHHVILWLAEYFTPSPSMHLVCTEVADQIGISLNAITAAVGGFAHHDVPAIRAWLVARGGL